MLVLWLSERDVPWNAPGSGEQAPAHLYLSASLYGAPLTVPAPLRSRTRFVPPHASGQQLSRLLSRSSGWRRARHIAARTPQDRLVQANAYFTVKLAGNALVVMRNLFSREHFIGRLEHMVDHASYTSVYPRVSLAPGQRFIVKGAYIARVSEDTEGGLVPVTEWLTP